MLSLRMYAMTRFLQLNIPVLSTEALVALVALLVIITILKGMALWDAARGGKFGWFVALMIINTLGILELVYLTWFSSRHAEDSDSSEA